MNKRIALVVIVVFLLAFTASALAFAAPTFQNVYDAYGLQKGDDEIASKLYDNPPTAIALKPISVHWYDIDMPLAKNTLILEQGKDVQFNIDVVGEKESQRVVKVLIKSSLTLGYRQDEDPRVLFSLDHNTHLKSYTGDSLVRDETSSRRSTAGGFGGHNDGELTVSVYLAREGGVGNLGIVRFRIEGVQVKKSKLGIFDINTNASSTPGETSTTLPAAVVIGLAGVVAAAAGAASGTGTAGASGQNTTEDNNKDSTYKMYISKDFGNKIRYGEEVVFVYGRIVEVPPEGEEVERLDLTEKIEIFSRDNHLDVGRSELSGDYMGAAVTANGDLSNTAPTEGVISFRFAGKGGAYQNNVKFQLVGDPYVSLDGPNLFVLAESGDSYQLPYELKDFMNEPKVTVRVMQDDYPFELAVGKDKDDNEVIIATDRTEKKPIERFFDNYTCEIIAENEQEYARTVFSVVMCYEGVLPDFLGKEKEIIAYKNEEDEMPITNIAFRLGLWNESSSELELRRPEEVEVSFTDKESIFEVIGLEAEVDLENSTSDYLLYAFRAEKSLPSPESILGTLSVVYDSGEIHFESDTPVKLMPDLLTYAKDREKEYQNCVQIIDTYLPSRFRARKHRELNASLDKMGLKDLQLFRKKCWEIAYRSIMQDKESYLIESYWYDEAIATAELVVYVGDVALDVALAPFGGPITGFVVTQVKASLIELISMRIEKGEIGYNEIYALITKRLEQGAGQADGLIEVPGFDRPKQLVAWLSCYILYRIMYRWYFDLDENKNPKGLYAAIENGLMDFAGKGASILLGEYAKGIAKRRGIDVGSTADKEQQWVNEQVESAAKTGLDAMDSVADSLDRKIAEMTAAIIDFIERIKSGDIQFT